MNNTSKTLSSWLQYATLEHEPLDYTKKGQDLLKHYDSSICKFFTVILTQKSIEKEKFENTPFVLTRYQTLSPPIRREAYKLMEKEHSNNYERVKEIISLHYPKEKTDPQIWNKEFDFYLESLLQSYYLEALDNLLYEWALFEKFTGETEDFEEEAYQKM